MIARHRTAAAVLGFLVPVALSCLAGWAGVSLDPRAANNPDAFAGYFLLSIVFLGPLALGVLLELDR